MSENKAKTWWHTVKFLELLTKDIFFTHYFISISIDKQTKHLLMIRLMFLLKQSLHANLFLKVKANFLSEVGKLVHFT